MIYNRIATIAAYGRLVPEVKWSQLKMQCNFYILKSHCCWFAGCALLLQILLWKSPFEIHTLNAKEKKWRPPREGFWLFILVRLWVSFIVIDLVGSARNPGFERFENTTEKWIQEFFLKYFEQEENSKWKAMNARLHTPPQSTENFF